jgi:hypothetical protein
MTDLETPVDPVNFIPADTFFQSVPEFLKPKQVISVISSSSTDKSDKLRYAAKVTLRGVSGDQDTICLVQFVTPQVWRVRYNPKFQDVAEYQDDNT